MNERIINRTGDLVLAQIAPTSYAPAETAFACYRETKTGQEYLDIVQSVDSRLAYHIAFGFFRYTSKHLATS